MKCRASLILICSLLLPTVSNGQVADSNLYLAAQGKSQSRVSGEDVNYLDMVFADSREDFEIRPISCGESCSVTSDNCTATDAHGCCSGENLLGDWGGLRSGLAESGIAVSADLTQFYQGVASGGNEQRFRYGDKLNLYVMMDTEKLGLWEGGAFQIHAADWQFGQNALADAAFLAPVNANLLTPKPGPSFALTHLLYEHQLGGGWAVAAGRNNLLDLWAMLYPDYGRGLEGFMNVSSLIPLNAEPSLPIISNMAGIIKAGERGVEAAFLVFESESYPTTVGLDFPNGVTMLAAGRIFTDFGGLPGSHLVAASYGTGSYTSFDRNGWIIVPPGGIIPAQKRGTWFATYVAEQRVWADPCNPTRYSKLFGYVGFGEAQTNPFQWAAALSYEAFGYFDPRPADRMGVAYFYTGLNSDFQNLFSLVTPLGDVHGGEVYYNMEITPWFHLTFDLQAVNPSIRNRDTALVLGSRARIVF